MHGAQRKEKQYAGSRELVLSELVFSAGSVCAHDRGTHTLSHGTASHVPRKHTRASRFGHIKLKQRMVGTTHASGVVLILYSAGKRIVE